MACGCPAVTSDAGALLEVAGGAAVATPADDPGSLATALREAMEPATARELRARGLRRARSFTWRRTAEEMMDLYARVGSRLEAAA